MEALVGGLEKSYSLQNLGILVESSFLAPLQFSLSSSAPLFFQVWVLALLLVPWIKQRQRAFSIRICFTDIQFEEEDEKH